jgi:hypothetical protein
LNSRIIEKEQVADGPPKWARQALVRYLTATVEDSLGWRVVGWVVSNETYLSDAHELQGRGAHQARMLRCPKSEPGKICFRGDNGQGVEFSMCESIVLQWPLQPRFDLSGWVIGVIPTGRDKMVIGVDHRRSTRQAASS